MFVYIISCAALIFANEKYVSNPIGFMYGMRVIQGFFGIAQPLGFTMISDAIPPANRTFANSFNNLCFFFAALVVTVVNAFVFPNISGVYSSEDNYITYRSSMIASTCSFFIAFICSFFIKETCPNYLMKKQCKKLNVPFKQDKKDEMTSW